MSDRPLVSIITPCYNSENFVERYLKSVLEQTYTHIELYLIDDGSTDKTKEIVESYRFYFEQKGMNLYYIYQENAGQAAAMNQALDKFAGEYLTWLDSDDFFLPTAIEERVTFLEEHTDCGFCVCQGKFVSESDLNRTICLLGRVTPRGEDNYFMDLIMEKNVSFASGGGGFFRRTSFLRAFPTRQIYPSREGQNWQMLLPMAYYYKCGYIEKPLFCVVGRVDSHSRMGRTPVQEVKRILGFVDLLTHVIMEMQIPEEKEILQIIRIKYAHRLLIVSATQNLHGAYHNLISEQYALLKAEGQLQLSDRIFYIGYRNPLKRFIMRIALEIYRIFANWKQQSL